MTNSFTAVAVFSLLSVVVLAQSPFPTCSKILNGRGEIHPGSRCCINRFGETTCLARDIKDDAQYVPDANLEWMVRAIASDSAYRADSLAVIWKEAERKRREDSAVQAEELAEKKRAKAARRNAELKRNRDEQDRINGIKRRGWPKAIEDAVIAKAVLIGMTTVQAREAWGPPDDINRTVTASNEREQWVYGLKSYLYFENGVLTTIQN